MGAGRLGVAIDFMINVSLISSCTNCNTYKYKNLALLMDPRDGLDSSSHRVWELGVPCDCIIPLEVVALWVIKGKDDIKHKMPCTHGLQIF